MEILYHHILTPCGEPADIIISALQKFIRRGKTEEAARAAYELYLSGEELRDYLWQTAWITLCFLSMQSAICAAVPRNGVPALWPV